jgi:hypothetical protein
MTVCIYVDTSKAVGDPEGVAFEYMFRDLARLRRAPGSEAQTKKPGREAEPIASVLP